MCFTSKEREACTNCLVLSFIFRGSVVLPTHSLCFQLLFRLASLALQTIYTSTIMFFLSHFPFITSHLFPSHPFPSPLPPPVLQCLSHLEDRLLELNERGLLLANNLMDHGNDVDLSEVLPATFKGLRYILTFGWCSI